jgi:hypothetical protein
MEVCEESHARGRIPARVCLLGQHRNVWTTLALGEKSEESVR